MALAYPSLITYGLEVTASNRSLDFKLSGGGPEIKATLNLGFYSLTSLADEIVRAALAANSSVTYAVTIDRSISGGLENRISIAATGGFLSLLFGTGSRAASSIASLIGFTPSDKTGATSYTGSLSAGTTLLTTLAGYNYKSPEFNQEVQGSRSISASGRKEAIVFQIQEFLEVEFKYESKSRITEWKNFFRWAIQQKPFEITPEFPDYNTFYEVTLEKTGKNQNGLGFQMNELLPQFPNFYSTGLLTFRKNVSAGTYILG